MRFPPVASTYRPNVVARSIQVATITTASMMMIWNRTPADLSQPNELEVGYQRRAKVAELPQLAVDDELGDAAPSQEEHQRGDDRLQTQIL